MYINAMWWYLVKGEILLTDENPESYGESTTLYIVFETELELERARES